MIMQTSRTLILPLTVLAVAAVTLAAGCGKQVDPIVAAVQADKKAGIAVPGIAEVKAIAEEAFISGDQG